MILKNGAKVFAYDDNLDNVFGESKDILDELKKSPNFSLNGKVSISTDKVLTIYCHKEKHSKLDKAYLPDFELFIGGDVTKIYS